MLLCFSWRNESWLVYGKPILAVADGTIDGVIDKFPDQMPNKPEGDDRLAYPGGNFVVQNIGGGNYVFYAHMKPGSIKVKAGDKVTRGQELGQVGNSGNSTGPHLHMHVMDGPSPLASHGVPYVFEKFKITGEVPNVSELDDSAGRGEPLVLGKPKLTGLRYSELPKEGVVLDFVE